MDALLGSMLLLVLGAQGAVWYKLGRIESALNGHIKHHNRSGGPAHAD